MAVTPLYRSQLDLTATSKNYKTITARLSLLTNERYLCIFAPYSTITYSSNSSNHSP